MGDRRRRRPAGQLEDEVLATLWASDEALTPGQVQQRIADRSLAYTTVLTILARLFDKGVVERERAGRAFAYRPVLDRAGLAARQMRALLDRTGDRTDVLARFVSGLSADDERVLADLLRDETGG